MISEGKSARETLIAHGESCENCGIFEGCVDNFLLPLIERESRLSIAAAYKDAADWLRHRDRPALMNPDTLEHLAKNIEWRTPEDAAHARAEHDRDREVREKALLECKQLLIDEVAKTGHTGIPAQVIARGIEKLLASVIEAQPDIHCGQPERDKRMLELCMDTSLIYYGPYPCIDCGKQICRLAKAQGGERFDYPTGPIYPNVNWTMHNCPITQCPRCEGTGKYNGKECAVCSGHGWWLDENGKGIEQPVAQPTGGEKVITEDVFTVTEGRAVLQLPWPIDAQSAAELLEWLAIVERRLNRVVDRGPSEEKK